jgi:hypothetical protein
MKHVLPIAAWAMLLLVAPSLAQPAGGNPLAGGNTQPNPLARGNPLAATAGQPKQLVVKRFELRDRQNNNMVSHHMLLPTGWQLTGGPIWNQQDSQLVRNDLRATAPDGSQIALFPGHSGTVNEHPDPQAMVNAMDPMTGQIRGQVPMRQSGQPAPQSASAYVRDVILPQARPFATNVRLGQEQIEQQATAAHRQGLQQQARQFQQMMQQAGSNDRVQIDGEVVVVPISYVENNQRFEEEVLVIANRMTMTFAPLMPGGPATTTRIWEQKALSVRAPAGQLQAKKPTFDRLAGTFRATPQWQNVVNQAAQQRAKVQGKMARDNADTFRKINQIQRETSDYVMNLQRQTYENRSASQDRIGQMNSEAIRGVNTWQPTAGSSTPVEVPLGWDHVYAGPNDTYILSNDPSYDPAADPNLTGNWQPMQKR